MFSLVTDWQLLVMKKNFRFAPQNLQKYAISRPKIKNFLGRAQCTSHTPPLSLDPPLFFGGLNEAYVGSALRWAFLIVLWIGFCLTGPISLWLDSFVFMFVCLVYLCLLHMCCIIATWWVGPGGIEAESLGPYLPSVLWHYWLGHLTHKNQSAKWPIMCRVGR